MSTVCYKILYFLFNIPGFIKFDNILYYFQIPQCLLLVQGCVMSHIFFFLILLIIIIVDNYSVKIVNFADDNNHHWTNFQL